jgi:uncharacterized protein
MIPFENCILYFFAYSFGGWVLESLYASALDKKPVNRGLLHGPFCPIYGFGALVVILSFNLAGAAATGNFSYIAVGIFLSMLLATLLEYVSGLLLFRLLERKYWDYTGSFWNVGGYVCLQYSLLWGLLSFIMVKGIHPQTVLTLSFLPPALKTAVSVLLPLYFLIDLALTGRSILKTMANQEPEALKEEYGSCVGDLLENATVQSMSGYIQHGDISCLEHCKNVSFKSYLICKVLKLDYRSAARAGLLHDYFLYDWHEPHRRWHGFHHPRSALVNATRDFGLNGMEKDIIAKHMWPLTLIPPRYRESLIVGLADKYCTVMEVLEPKTEKILPARLRKQIKIILER